VIGAAEAVPFHQKPEAHYHGGVTAAPRKGNGQSNSKSNSKSKSNSNNNRNGGGQECPPHIRATALGKIPTQAKRRLEWGTGHHTEVRSEKSEVRSERLAGAGATAGVECLLSICVIRVGSFVPVGLGIDYGAATRAADCGWYSGKGSGAWSDARAG
jgi:hypothetical protein